MLRLVFSPDPVMASGRVLENRYCRLPFTTWKVVVLANVPSDIVRILGPGQQVELYIQQKIYHPKINVDSVILTTQRIILRHPHELGLKKDFTDFNYTDVANAILDKAILRSTVKIMLRFGGDPLSLNDLPNSDAEKAYGIIRSNISRFQTPFSTDCASMAAASAIRTRSPTPAAPSAVRDTRRHLGPAIYPAPRPVRRCRS